MKSMKNNPKKPSSGLNMVLEYSPLVLFFVVNAKFGIYYGTAVLVAATVVSVTVSWVHRRYIPKMLSFGCGALVVFGGLTLIFKDDTFIKLKPTVVSLIIAAVLWGGGMIGRNPLKSILGNALSGDLSESGWRGLTRLWIAMFITMAAANELARRILSTDDWVTFKVFGLTGLSLVFAVLIAVFLHRKTIK
jgi:intracellular septation protein